MFFLLLATTGLRISEAIALEWRHVQLDGSSPHVKIRQRIVRGELGLPKSRHSRREIPISHTLVQAVRDHRKQGEWPGDTDPMFPTTTGTVLAPNNLGRHVLKPAAEEAGAPWAGFRTFRHTCTSLLFAEGRKAVQVQRWRGHHSPRVCARDMRASARRRHRRAARPNRASDPECSGCGRQQSDRCVWNASNAMNFCAVMWAC